MASANVEQLTDFLQETFDSTLRSVVYYRPNSHEIVYARGDVFEQYTTAEVEEIVGYLRHESMGKEATERRYPHGELACEMEIYESAAEINFIFGRGEGVAVGLDPEAFVAQQTFIQKCIKLLELDDNLSQM